MKMKYPLIPALVGLLALGSCSDVTTLDTTTFVVRGKAEKGAHTRAPISGGYVGLILPSKNGLYQFQFSATGGVPNKTVTAADGTYTFVVKQGLVALATLYPLYLGVSDAAQTFTMLSQVPLDLASVGAVLAMDINPTTTAAAQMVCPGGVYPPPSGAYCYTDPNNHSSTNISTLDNVIGASLSSTSGTLETGTPPDWSAFMTALLNDASVFTQLKALAGAGITRPTNTVVPPKITKPIVGVDDNVPKTPTDSGSSSSECGCTCDNGASCTGKPSGFCGSDSNGIPNACGCPAGSGCDGRGHSV